MTPVVVVSSEPVSVRDRFEGEPITRLTFDRAEAALREIEAVAEANRHCTERMYEEAEFLLEVQRQCRLGMLASYIR